MAGGLDLLGRGLDRTVLGAGEALATKYVTVRVTSVDADKLSRKVGGAAGSLVSAGLFTVDHVPNGAKMALDSALPRAQKFAKDEYGVSFEYKVDDAPPPPGAKVPSHAGGVALGAGAVGLAWLLKALLF